MRPLPRPRQWRIGALLAVAVVTVPVVAQAQPDDGTRAVAGAGAASVIEHHSLDDALAEVGTTRAEFSSESSLAERLAAASMGQPDTNVGELCTELGVTRQTLYRHVSPTGELRPDATKLLGKKNDRLRGLAVSVSPDRG